MKIYVKINGEFTEFEDTPQIRQGLHLDKQIAEQAGKDFQIFEPEQLSDEDKLTLGLTTEAELTEKARATATNELSSRCQSERIKILDDTRIMNILSGATAGYPEYLTPANVAEFIEIYKKIYHDTKSLIDNAGSKAEIEGIMKNLSFPTEAEIMDNMV